MDSLTQLALGAAVGEAVLGRKVGNRAILWGAVCGTLPDLDVFVPFGGPVADFTYHRSWSHSIFVLTALTPVVVWIIRKVHASPEVERWRWHVLVFLAFATHILLDCFTVYGTQVFWPLSETPVAWSTIFIIDPLYTVPVLVGVVAALVMTRTQPLGHRINGVGLLLSTLYLAWTVVAKSEVERVARASLEGAGHRTERLLSTPSPFNSLLWRIVVMDRDGYLEGFYSLLDDGATLAYARYPSRPELIADISRHWPVQRLKWFTKGFFSVSAHKAGVIITDLRMGLEAAYIFRFVVGELNGSGVMPIAGRRLDGPRDYRRLWNVWWRIWDPRVSLAPQ